MTKIDGRKAVVTNTGRLFLTYGDFAIKHGYPDAHTGYPRYNKRVRPNDGDVVTLLTGGPHLTGYHGKTLWIVETAQGDRYIIGEDGLEIVKEAEAIGNITLLTDDIGLQREYREVKRKAAVGERIKIVAKSGSIGEYRDGSVLTVTESERWSHPIDEGGVSVRETSTGIFHSEYAVLEPSDIVIIDSQRHRVVERKANVGERVVVVAHNGSEHSLDIGSEHVISHDDSLSGEFDVKAQRDDSYGYMYRSEYRVLEPVKAYANSANSAVPTPDINVIVDGLTDTCAKLALRVTELERKVGTRTVSGTVTDGIFRSSPEQRHAARERLADRKLSRDEIVELAKKDVAELEAQCSAGKRAINGVNRFVDVNFHVNRDKRTVVAVLVGLRSARVWGRGKARCAPDDCFNVHIGKAVALRRALGLDVPEYYVKAPQPAEVRVGDVVDFTHHGGEVKRYTIVESFARVGSNGAQPRSEVAKHGHIIDDSRDGGER